MQLTKIFTLSSYKRSLSRRYGNLRKSHTIVFRPPSRASSYRKGGVKKLYKRERLIRLGAQRSVRASTHPAPPKPPTLFFYRSTPGHKTTTSESPIATPLETHPCTGSKPHQKAPEPNFNVLASFFEGTFCGCSCGHRPDFRLDFLKVFYKSPNMRGF